MGKIYISRKAWNKTVLMLLIICVGAIWWFGKESERKTIWEEASSLDIQNNSIEVIEDEIKEWQVSEQEAMKEESSVVLCGVHVTGAVNRPDQVLYLPEGTRVGEAIKAAGGASEEADLSQMNLAGYIQDGQKIYVPILGEKLTNIENLQGENRENPLTNINLATKIELLNLPGIGETYAERIIQYREENGPFETVEDIMEVKGIGESKFNDLKDKITVE